LSRFYQTQLVNPRSGYVAPPWELMKNKLNEYQQIQDQYKAQIELLNKPFNSLVNDYDFANQLKTDVDTKLEDLRKLDYNDPTSRSQIMGTIKDVQNMYSPQGSIGLVQNKYNQYVSLKDQIEKADKQGDTYKSYRLKQLQNNLLDENRIIKNPDGTYTNTSITDPEAWTWKDKNKEWDDAIKSVAYDSFKSTNPNWQGTSADAVSMYFLKGGDQLTKKKIDNAMYSRFASDYDLIKSVQAESDLYDRNIDESQFATVDNSGNIQWNPETLIGQMMLGRNEGAAFYRDKTEHGTVTDQITIDRAKHTLENPPPILLGKEAIPLMYGTGLDNTNSLSTKITDNEQALRSEYAKLLESEGFNPEIAKRVASRSTLEQMNLHVSAKRNSSLKGLTNTYDSLYSAYDNLNLLNNEADNYANKTVGVKADASKINNIQNLTKEETAEVYKLIQTGAKTYTELSSNPAVMSDNKRLQDLYKKAFGKNPDLNSFGVMTEMNGMKDLESAINNANDNTTYLDSYLDYDNKREKVKNEYLKNNANQKAKENIVLNQIVFLNTDTNGNTIIDTDNTNKVNKQIDAYFSSNNYNSIYTTILNPDTGAFYTLEEYRLKKQADAVKDDPKAKVNIGKPWYAQYSETQTNNEGNTSTAKHMYVDVGGESVKINQNQLYVNVGQGLVPLSQVNNTPQNSTENWLATTASYGIREKPIQLSNGAKVVVNNAKTAGNYADGNDLKVTYYNPDGSQNGAPLVGPAAFNYLTSLQKQGLLK
jgi:hypothetical protein